MRSNKRVVTCALDGFHSPWETIAFLRDLFLDPRAREYVGMVKLEDALFFPGLGPAVVGRVQNVLPQGVGIFLDLKLLRTVAATRHILEAFAPARPAVITVSAEVSLETLDLVREMLPEPETKIALVVVTTDIGEKEYLERWGVSVVERFARTLRSLAPLVDAVVCGPEITPIRHCQPRLERYVVGVRGVHVPIGDQKRTITPVAALDAGAASIVMGTALQPEYRQQTWDELDQYFGRVQVV